MGERLNISINRGNKIIANSYFHWSGYTPCALELTNKVMFAYGSLNPAWFQDEKMYAIALLQHTGASLSFSPVEKLQFLKKVGEKITLEQIQEQENLIKEYVFLDKDYEISIHRNNGLIAISSWDIKNTEGWEEERVSIDIENNTIDFSACWIETVEEFKKEQEEMEEKTTIKEWPYQFSINQIPFSEWDKVSTETLYEFAEDKFCLKHDDDIFLCIC